ncbi:MAG: hypothetical protein HN655_05915 [Candidatus Marinimicrobia bacterium]|jgi:hypothetical protein|nr:hypothetical protein [Candidatus Neomarinimicrobiota bacterium]MBT7515378.1 hypothetical protein [Candidatus Neomarinimicrobiota bacterium]
MSDSFPNIKSVVVRVITDKPVRKTPYQVKGVFMRQYPDEPIIPMLDGSYRDRFLYPRVQVKILNEQIYLIGVHEGVDTILSIAEKFKTFDFGNITFEVMDCDIENAEDQFIPSSRLVRYRFITPWVALNHMTGGRYQLLTNQEKPSFLNRLLGQNIIFLANEVGVNLEENVFTKVQVSSLFPRPVDENKWGAFMGEFKTNFVLPNYIGVGNGITRGFGTIYSMFNPDSFMFDEAELKQESKVKVLEPVIEKMDDMESVSAADVPKPRRRRKSHSRPQQHRSEEKSKSQEKTDPPKKKRFTKDKNKNQHQNTNQNSNQNRNRNQNQKQSQPRRPHRTGRVFSEEFDIEDDGKNVGNRVSENKSDSKDESKFNTDKHHQRQHKF